MSFSEREQVSERSQQLEAARADYQTALEMAVKPRLKGHYSFELEETVESTRAQLLDSIAADTHNRFNDILDCLQLDIDMGDFSALANNLDGLFWDNIIAAGGEAMDKTLGKVPSPDQPGSVRHLLGRYKYPSIRLSEEWLSVNRSEEIFNWLDQLEQVWPDVTVAEAIEESVRSFGAAAFATTDESATYWLAIAR